MEAIAQPSSTEPLLKSSQTANSDTAQTKVIDTAGSNAASKKLTTITTALNSASNDASTTNIEEGSASIKLPTSKGTRTTSVDDDSLPSWVAWGEEIRRERRLAYEQKLREAKERGENSNP